MSSPKGLRIPRDFGGISEEEAGAFGGCDVLAEAEDAHTLDSEDFGEFAVTGKVGVYLFLQGSWILCLSLADEEGTGTCVDDVVGGEWRGEGGKGLGTCKEMSHHGI